MEGDIVSDSWPRAKRVDSVNQEGMRVGFLDKALELAAEGFHVFPITPNAKAPSIIKDYPNRASRNPDQIKKWWINPATGVERPYNIGISTTRFGDNEALVGVDVDNKGTKRGDDEILKLEIEGKDFPPTFTQTTPTGGRHLIYRTKDPLKQGTSVLANGVDIRSRGGYLVGSGSVIEGREYQADFKELTTAPPWIVQSCGIAKEKEPKPVQEIKDINPGRAAQRAIFYLEMECEKAEQGERNHAGYITACKLKDFGVDEYTCAHLMLNFWKCEPMLDHEELGNVVKSAYRYGTNPVGAISPEAEFEEIKDSPEGKDLHPFEKLNQNHAFVIAGGGSHILWETVDSKGRYSLQHLSIKTFHEKHASNLMTVGDGKTASVTSLWMKSPRRRSYDGICFMPGLEAPERFYNLWRGFAVEPLNENETPTPTMIEAVDMFLEHVAVNVCRNDKALAQWLIGYFAHMMQKPWEKPLVALVFRGGKGVGKSSLIERIGYLLGGHFMSTSERRYLVGNFNGHLENLVLFTLEEAFWSGDKQAEGTLKNLITGNSHIIEHKGEKPYVVDNCTRVVIIGNEDWLVPASYDERRFAVFDVGDEKKQNREYFYAMKRNLEGGGYRHLLSYLLRFDTSKVDVNAAPTTSGLQDQKMSSLDPFQQWWHECLSSGAIVGADFEGDWPRQVDKERFRSAFRRYVKDRQIRSWIPDDAKMGKLLKSMSPAIISNQRRRDGDRLVTIYRMPPLQEARADWDKFIGHESVWE